MPGRRIPVEPLRVPDARRPRCYGADLGDNYHPLVTWRTMEAAGGGRCICEVYGYEHIHWVGECVEGGGRLSGEEGFPVYSAVGENDSCEACYLLRLGQSRVF